MSKAPEIDLQAAHKHFSAYCFNHAWDYIEKVVRTADEDNTMLQLSMSSLWHWTQRKDCSSTNLSIGYWQVSRVYALLHQAENAKKYGRLCLEAAQRDGVPPYYLGGAYEALARAELTAGNQDAMEENLAQALKIADGLKDAEEKEMLLKDLSTLH